MPAQSFITYVDSLGLVPLAPNKDFNLASPDAVVWEPSITTVGVLSFATNALATVSTVPGLRSPSNIQWDPTIANTGVITITNNASIVDAPDAAILDSNGILWYWRVNASDVVFLSTEPPIGRGFYNISTKVTHSAGSEFAIYEINPNANIRRR